MTRAVDVASLPPTIVQSGGTIVTDGNTRLSNGTGFTSANSLVRQIESVAGAANQFTIGSIGFVTGSFVDQGQITFSTNNSSTNTERMRIDNNGNVGIGTSSVTAGYRLEVSGAGIRNTATNPFYDLYASGQSANNKWWRLTGTGGSGSAFAVVSINDAGNNAEAPYQITRSGHLAQAHIWSTNATERMRIDSSGQVGIGTAAPIGLFQVSGANDTLMYFTNTSGAIRLRPYITSVAYSQISATNAGGTAYTPLSIGGSVTIFEVNGAEKGRFSSNGTFCINTTAPYAGSFSSFNSGTAGAWPIETLGVDRGIVSRMTSNAGFAAYYETNNGTSIAGNIYVAGTTTTYATSSDYRLKENIKPMQNALDKVALLNPVTYTWKHDNSAGQGFIAHELQAVVPEAVTGEKDAVDAEGNPIYQGVDASFLVATLTKAIQELTAKVESLEKEISVLKSI